MPDGAQRRLAATVDLYVPHAEPNVLYVRVSDVTTTKNAYWSGTAFANVTQTGVRISLPISGLNPPTFSDAFANPAEILAEGHKTCAEQVLTSLDWTPGYELSSSGVSTYDLHTTTGESDGFAEFDCITGATRIRGGGVFQLTFDPGTNLDSSVNFAAATVETEYGRGSQFIDAALVQAPSVAEGAASEIWSGAATLRATVNPNGRPVTGCHFEYGPTSSYGSSGPCSSIPESGDQPTGVFVRVGGLAPAATYHYRIVATNQGGTSYGVDQTFRTVSAGARLAIKEAESGVVLAPGAVAAATLQLEYCRLQFSVKTVSNQKPKDKLAAVAKAPSSCGSAAPSTLPTFELSSAGTLTVKLQPALTIEADVEYYKCVYSYKQAIVALDPVSARTAPNQRITGKLVAKLSSRSPKEQICPTSQSVPFVAELKEAGAAQMGLLEDLRP